MASATLLLQLTSFVDAEGQRQWLEVRPEVAELLAAVEPKLKERLLRQPERINEVRDRSQGGGSAWDGPRLRFRWLVGESRTWHGEPVVENELGWWECSICRGQWLPSYAYCLGCDRCGRELEVPGAGEVDRMRSVEESQLKGGCEGKR